MTIRCLAIVAAAIASAAFAEQAALAAPAPQQRAAAFRVGAAVEPINPATKVYLGGYQSGPPGGTVRRHVNPLTGRLESLTVRAIAIDSGSSVVEMASIDGQGSFAGYQEGSYGLSDMRAAVAAYLQKHGRPQATAADLIISTLHEHAVPALYGIYAPYAFNLAYLKQVYAQTVKAMEVAYARAVPATIRVGTADAPWLGGGNIPEANEFEGWRRDGSLVAFWARNAQTGATIATYVSEPAYPNIVYGDEDLLGTNHSLTLISTDFPSYTEAALEQRLGGIAILASGSLANQASPFQADLAPSPDLPRVDRYQQTRAFDDIIVMGGAVANVTFGALARAKPLTAAIVGGAEQYVLSVVTNPAVSALTYGNVNAGAPWAPLGQLTHIYPADRSVSPPYAAGDAFGTWVTALRIANVALVTEPGEFFGSIRQAWSDGIKAPGGVFVVGNAQDYLGYEYPADVTPFTAYGGDELIFNPSPLLGDQVLAAGTQVAGSLGFATDPTANAELAALDPQYARIAATGAYLLPQAVTGDVDPKTRGFTAVFDAAGSPPRAQMVCDNPALVYNPGVCPVSDPPVRSFRFDFGDGTTASYQPQGQARATFAPFVHHTYGRPGVYRVALTVDAAGQSSTVTLPVTVNPALRVRVTHSHGRDVAHVTGGDGRVVILSWRLANGTVVNATSIARIRDPVSVTAVDGTGTVAVTRVN
jgi:hypothetical protein